MLSVIVPASNEAGWIGGCLTALFAAPGVAAEAIVVANGCRDDTAAVARGFAAQAQAAGWGFRVLDLAEGGKPRALDAGDAAAAGADRLYLDADVRIGPGLIAGLAAVLARPGPVYASGRAVIPRPKSPVTRSYARFWNALPFARSAAPGHGLFAVNAAGRARWGAFPAIISDDTYVRAQFAPHERVTVDAPYTWPMVEGFGPLVRVRRRQDAGVAEIRRLYPGLLPDTRDTTPADLIRAGMRDPSGLAVYAAVSLAVRSGRGPGDWVRGR